MPQYDPLNTQYDTVLSKIWDIVLEHGADLSIEEFASAVHLSTPEFNALFPSRSALILALIDWVDHRENAIEDLQFCNNIQDPMERFYTTLETWIDFIPKVFPVALEFMRLRFLDMDIQATWQNRMELTQEWFLGCVQALHDAGLLAANWSVKKATDFMWVNSSFYTWELLTIDRGWSHKQTKSVIRQNIASMILRPDLCPSPEFDF